MDVVEKKQSVLAKKQLDDEDIDDLDDLDDDIEELDDALTVPVEQIAEAEKIEKRITGQDRKELTTEEKRAALRRSIAEKRSARGARGRNIKYSRQCLNQQVSNLMANPEVESLMQSAMEGDTVEKLLQSTGLNSGVSANQIRQVIKTAGRKK